jgi:hypothetical protein
VVENMIVVFRSLKPVKYKDYLISNKIIEVVEDEVDE